MTQHAKQETPSTTADCLSLPASSRSETDIPVPQAATLCREQTEVLDHGELGEATVGSKERAKLSTAVSHAAQDLLQQPESSRTTTFCPDELLNAPQEASKHEAEEEDSPPPPTAREKQEAMRNIKAAHLSVVWLRLRDAPVACRDDRDVVMAAVARDGMALRYASRRLQGDRLCGLLAVERAPRYLVVAPENLRDDRDVVIAAIHRDWSSIVSASERLKDDEDVAMAAVCRSEEALRYISPRFKQSGDLALNPGLSDYSPHNVARIKSKTLLLALFAQHPRHMGQLFQAAIPLLQEDRDVAMTVLLRDSSIAQHVGPNLKRNDKLVLMTLVTVCPSQAASLLNDARDGLKADLDVLLTAFRAMGYHVPDVCRCAEMDTVRAAVTNDGLFLQYVSSRMRSDKDIVLAAVSQNGLALQFADSSLKSDREVVFRAMEQNAAATWFVAESLRKTDAELLRALEKSFAGPSICGPGVCAYSCLPGNRC